MNTESIIKNNDSLRRELPHWVQLFFAVFAVWEMNIDFFSTSPAAVGGAFFLPVHADAMDIVIFAGYIVVFLTLIFLQKQVVLLSKIGFSLSIFFSLMLLFPLSETFTFLCLYSEMFLCVFLTGTTFTMVLHFFTAENALHDSLMSVIFSCLFALLLHNDFFTMPFIAHQAVIIGAQIMVLATCFVFPKGGEIQFLDHSSRRLTHALLKTCGFFFAVFTTAFLSAYTVAYGESLPNDLELLPIMAVIGAISFLLLWQKRHLSPKKLYTCFFLLLAVGLLLSILPISGNLSVFVSGALFGLTTLLFSLYGYFGGLVFRILPSRWLAPAYVLASLLGVVVFHLLSGHSA